MLNENLKALRKQKGYTQEELAIKLNVVRQTISKWEKGLSVPDVDMLEALAAALDTTIGELLGSKPIEETPQQTDVAMQLGRIAEQLAIKNARRRKIWKVIKGIILADLIIIFLAGVIVFFGLTGYRVLPKSSRVETGAQELACTVDCNSDMITVRLT